MDKIQMKGRQKISAIIQHIHKTSQKYCVYFTCWRLVCRVLNSLSPRDTFSLRGTVVSSQTPGNTTGSCWVCFDSVVPAVLLYSYWVEMKWVSVKVEKMTRVKSFLILIINAWSEWWVCWQWHLGAKPVTESCSVWEQKALPTSFDPLTFSLQDSVSELAPTDGPQGQWTRLLMSQSIRRDLPQCMWAASAHHRPPRAFIYNFIYRTDLLQMSHSRKAEQSSLHRTKLTVLYSCK